MDINYESRFAVNPEVNIDRSAFDRSFSHKTTFNSGKLIPIYLDEVLPGDTFEVDLSALVRMTTPIFPVCDNAFLDVYFFFVPNRLVWEHWEEFMGENKDTAWSSNTEYTVPQLYTLSPGDSSGGYVNQYFDEGSVGDYFGLPTKLSSFGVSALPFRAYAMCWSEWFRDQNVMTPAFIPKDDSIRYVRTTSDGSYDPAVASLGYQLLPVAKYHDYFTSALPSAQRGNPVTISLLDDMAPVITGVDAHGLSELPMEFLTTDGSGVGTGLLGFVTGQSGVALGNRFSVPSGASASGPVVPSNLYANLNNLAVATVNELRMAFQVQKLLERDARGGTRYREILQSHFGVTSPDSRMQIPEYLGGKRIPINITQVAQTSESQVTPQGNMSAFSLTTDVDSMFTKSFVEHGLILGLACVRTQHTYQQGINRMWSRTRRYDYYWPVLDSIGEMPILNKEVYAYNAPVNDQVFGYQEAWADYRYKPNYVTGLFRSNATGSLDAWHYADNFADTPVLNMDFISETDKNIQRTLAVQDEDQFIGDFYFKVKVVRPMSLYSIPGLIDHH